MTEPVRLSVTPEEHGQLVTGRLALDTKDGPLAIELTVPADPVPTEAMLPVLRDLSNLFVARGIARAEREGKSVSCRAGCTACCRQLIPVSGAEARAIAALVAAMPEPRQTQVRARFDAVLTALDAAGMLERMVDATQMTSAGEGLAYLRLGIDCVFLEDGMCSIYADRPLVCREFLVTSPPDECATPENGRIAGVKLEWDMSGMVIRALPDDAFTALPLALAHAERPAPPPRTGAAMMSAVIATQQR